jgi:hypothetical protein
MKTREQIETELAKLRARLEADDFDGAEDNDEPDWADTSNRITALEWILGISDDSEGL